MIVGACRGFLGYVMGLGACHGCHMGAEMGHECLENVTGVGMSRVLEHVAGVTWDMSRVFVHVTWVLGHVTGVRDMSWVFGKCYWC